MSTTGEWRWKFRIDDFGASTYIGVATQDTNMQEGMDQIYMWSIRLGSGNIYGNGKYSKYGSKFSQGD